MRQFRSPAVGGKKLLVLLVVFISLVAGVFGGASNGVFEGAAWAATSPSQQQRNINNQLSQLREEFSEVSEEAGALLEKLDATNNRKAELDAQVATLQGQIDIVQVQLNDATNRLNAVQQEVERAEDDLLAAERQLEESTRLMQEKAVDAYVGKDASENLATFMFKAEDMQQATVASEYLQQVVTNRRTIVEQHRELQGQAEDLKKQLEQKKAEAEAARNAIVQQQDVLVGQRAQLASVQTQVAAEVQAQQQVLAEVEQKRASIQQEMDALQAQSDSIAAMLRNGGSSGATIPPGNGALSNPVPGARISSRFGMRVNPVTGRNVLHAGIDLAVITGTPLHASESGTVVSVIPTASSGGYGNYTCIKHSGGLATCYAHQSQFLVSVGDKVVRGQVIGLSGNTGNSTGPHLHWEVRVNGNPVDPLSYL